MYARTSRSVHASERKKVSIYSNARCRCKARKRLPSLLARVYHAHPPTVLRPYKCIRAKERCSWQDKGPEEKTGRKTRTAIVVEETFAIIRKLAFFLLFPFYEALRKYFVLFTQRITKKRPPPINIIFSIPLLPACFEILRAEFRWSR